MKISLQISSYFNRYVEIPAEKDFELNASSTSVLDLLNILGIPDSEVGFIIINGKRSDRYSTLHDNDSISILPQLIGG